MIRMEDEPEEQVINKQNPFEGKIEQLLLSNRRIFLSEDVNSDSTRDIIRKLWFLELSDPGKPILFVINSPGGAVDSGFAIWDQVKMITSPVKTLVTGLAASMGSVLSLCASPGHRYATPHSRIMIHQPRIHAVIRGQATDLEIHAQEIEKTREQLVDIYADATKQSKDVIRKALDRDRWYTAEEALEFGLLDKVVTSYKQLG